MSRLVTLTVVLVLAAASWATAEVARNVTWDDLVPAAEPLADPLADLTVDQQIEMETIARIRELAAQGLITPVDPNYEFGVELTDKLKKQGIDVEGLLTRYTAMMKKIEQRSEAVVSELEGENIRMPGYVLPLEFSDSGVSEFLLVPYIGACIHVPPPPPNQMVFVRLNQTFKADDLYTPVWITGKLSVQRTSQSLSLVDGQSDVAAGYVLDGTKVEPYEE